MNVEIAENPIIGKHGAKLFLFPGPYSYVGGSARGRLDAQSRTPTKKPAPNADPHGTPDSRNNNTPRCASSSSFE